MDWARVLLGSSQSVRAVDRSQYRVAARLKDSKCKPPQMLFVLDEEHRLVTTMLIILDDDRGGFLVRRRDKPWQMDCECGSTSKLAPHSDVAARLFHDAVDCRQS